MTTQPSDNVDILGPVFIAADGQPVVTVDELGLQEFKVIDVDNPNEPASDLNSDFQLTLTAGDTVIATFDENSPEVNFDASTGCVEVDFSSLDLPPGAYTIDIGEGFSQQYYVPQLGDVNRDGVVNFADITPFINLLTTSEFQYEADINGDGAVNFLDISPFIALLSN